MSARPLPVSDATSADYWAACARHELTLPRCARCGRFTLPPDITCPHCHTTDPQFAFEPVGGAGTIRTWTVVRRSFLSGFDVPFMLVDVALDAQPHIRMIGRLLDGPDAPVAIGDPVEVAFEDLSPEIAVPAFRLATRA